MTDLDRFVNFAASVLTTEDGSPLILEDWQLAMLDEHFAGVRELLILMPKKLGKSSLLAGRGIYELITRSFANVAVVAASRDQAGLILGQFNTWFGSPARVEITLDLQEPEVDKEKCKAARADLKARNKAVGKLLGKLRKASSAAAKDRIREQLAKAKDKRANAAQKVKKACT